MRKIWELWFRVNRRGLKSIRSVAELAGLDHKQLSDAINAGFGSDRVRAALKAIDLPHDMIPLPSSPHELAGIVFEQRERMSRRPEI